MDVWGRRFEWAGVVTWLAASTVGVYSAFGPGVGSTSGKAGAIGLLTASLAYGAGAVLQEQAHRRERDVPGPAAAPD